MFSGLSLGVALKALPYLLGAALVLGVGGYIWYLRSDNTTLTSKLQTAEQALTEAVQVNQQNAETFSELRKDALEATTIADQQQRSSTDNDKRNEQAKKELRNEPTASEHVSPYIGNVFDRLRVLQSTEGTGQN